jgi:MFS family permease
VAADPPPGPAPGEVSRRLAASLQAVKRVLSNPDLRRLEIAWTLAIAAEWALIVALLVFTYERGGTFGVGLLGVARTLPTLVGVPLASTLGDRHSRIRLMLGCYLIALATSVAAAIAMAQDAPLLVVLAVAAVNAVATTAIRPLQNTIIPSLARSPEELVAANVATSTGEGIGVLVGPGLGGILMVFGPAVVATAGAVGMALATIAFTRIRDKPARLRPTSDAADGSSGRRMRSHFAVGFAALRTLPTPTLLMAVFGVQPFVRGVLTVLIVAASIDLLGLGDPGVGLLNAAIGAGGIIGAVATILLIGHRRLAVFFLLALAFWGAPISVVGLLPVALVAVVAMGVIGGANAVLDVAGFTTLQRTIPNEVRASVLGVFEGYIAAMAGLGGLAAPLLLSVFGIAGALVVTGAILPVLAVVSSRIVLRADDIALVPERQLTLLRGIAMFAPLPITTIEQLAGSLVPVRFAAGEVLMLAGDPGDRFILIESGTVEVEQDGATLRSIGPGGSVGEIALLRGIPRTATVRAVTEVSAFALDSASFIAAVTGDRDAARSAEHVVDARLANADDGST